MIPKITNVDMIENSDMFYLSELQECPVIDCTMKNKKGNFYIFTQMCMC